jgi:hypothetical protein
MDRVTGKYAEPFPDHPSELRAGLNGHANGKATSHAKGRKPRADGRFQTLNTFVDFSMAELKRADLVVWLTLYRDSRDGVARTSQAQIAKRGGLTVRAVKVAVAKLAKVGLLKVVHQGGQERGISRYQVLPLTPPVAGEAHFPSPGEA